MVTKIGTSGRDFLHGTNAADLLKGLGGNDDLFGAGGIDRIFGGIGDDKLFGDAGNDRLFGEAGSDILHGGIGNDTVDGGAGNDTLFGDGGSDLLLPGAGDDVVKGGAGIDTASYANASSAVSVVISDLGTGGSSGGAGADVYYSVEIVIGSSFNDEIEVYGNASAFGGPGFDSFLMYDEAGFHQTATFRGDDGNDLMNGYNGAANFWLQYNRGADTIISFTGNGDDRFLVSAKEFHLPAALVGSSLPAGRFLNNLDNFRASNADQRFIQHGGLLWADLDGSGNQYHSVPIADLTGQTFLISDFFIVA